MHASHPGLLSNGHLISRQGQQDSYAHWQRVWRERHPFLHLVCLRAKKSNQNEKEVLQAS